ncbi:MAG: HNH endonuclease signature motif containing protein [bacterium]|nr:HNH endonuclease signature motif containing protein [bacterium]
MYEQLLDYPEEGTIRPDVSHWAGWALPEDRLFMSAYQQHRQRVYGRAEHMTRRDGYRHAEVEDAKTEAALVRAEAQISRARGEQLRWIKSFLLNRSAVSVGCRSAVDYVVSRADVRRSTARELVYLAERLDVETVERIRDGAVSYGRVLEETRLQEAGAPQDEIERSRELDLDKAGRVAQQYKKMTRDRERHTFESQYVAFQPSLDGTHVRVSGRLGAAEAEVCRQGLDRRGEQLVPAGEARPDPGLRRALALTTLCHDQLDNGTAPGARSPDAASPGRNRREPLLMVLARNPVAEGSGFEQGVAVLAGQRVGPDNVDLIRCSGRTELITLAGQDIIHHGSRTSIRPATRRAVLARDDGCTVDGCNSTYRLEVHHIIPVSKGGTHAPENLTTLCWWHHHVAVHRRGMRIDPQSPPQRRRLLPTSRSCGYHPPAPDPHTLAILRALPTNFGRAPP